MKSKNSIKSYESTLFFYDKIPLSMVRSLRAQSQATTRFCGLIRLGPNFSAISFIFLAFVISATLRSMIRENESQKERLTKLPWQTGEDKFLVLNFLCSTHFENSTFQLLLFFIYYGLFHAHSTVLVQYIVILAI